MFRLTRIVMYMAPVAAGAALAYTVGSMGLATLLPLGKLVVTYYVALGVFVLLVLVPILVLGAHSGWGGLRRRLPSRRRWALRRHVRGRAAAGDGAHGRVRRAALDCLVRDSYRLQLQHDGVEPLSLHGGDLCRAGRGHAPDVWASRSVMLFTLMLTSKGVAGVPRSVLVILMGTAGSFHIPTAAVLMHSRRGHADGYGAHGDECDRQLHGGGGGGAVGRGVAGNRE